MTPGVPLWTELRQKVHRDLIQEINRDHHAPDREINE
jgi:hypothetical protein